MSRNYQQTEEFVREGERHADRAMRDHEGKPTDGRGLREKTSAPWPEIRNALRLALQFAEDEIENRESAGGSMSDYINEAQDVADTCRAALKAASGADE
jgi:hypothetical protein